MPQGQLETDDAGYDPQDEVKIAVLAGVLLSGLLGAWVLAYSTMAVRGRGR